ncbi:MAG: TlyA family RNA methyltransferase [Planctomycetes bacterium]|nr:TlyA family RNA methyltransferase [Planctomycetota bacterium]
MSTDPPCPFVSRGGLKLAAALDAFGIDPTGLTCADLGCNVGGFTDCLLQRGAGHVYSVDTGYGTFAWKLRNDPRVTVLERSNALHLDPWANPGFAGVELVAIDLGWTRQLHAIPAALRWLRRSSNKGRIVTLIKPHYEADRGSLSRSDRGVLTAEDAKRISTETLDALPVLGVTVLGCIESPLRGGAGKGREGNIEYLALLAKA